MQKKKKVYRPVVCLCHALRMDQGTHLCFPDSCPRCLDLLEIRRQRSGRVWRGSNNPERYT